MKFRIILFLICMTTYSVAQDSIDVRQEVNTAFVLEYNAMVDSLRMTDSVEFQFHKIYREYGETMKEAYDNRTSWSGLNHIYQWAKNDRDSKMKAILDDEQFYFFKKQQAIIESNARRRRAEEKRLEGASQN